MKVFIMIGAISMMLSVALGAFGAHALKDMLTERMLANWQTGVLYQMVHSLGILALGGLLLKVSTMVISCMADARRHRLLLRQSVRHGIDERDETRGDHTNRWCLIHRSVDLCCDWCLQRIMMINRLSSVMEKDGFLYEKRLLAME